MVGRFCPLINNRSKWALTLAIALLGLARSEAALGFPNRPFPGPRVNCLDTLNSLSVPEQVLQTDLARLKAESHGTGFVPLTEAQADVNSALSIAYLRFLPLRDRILDGKVRQLGHPLSEAEIREAEEEAFEKIFYRVITPVGIEGRREGHEGLVIIDTPILNPGTVDQPPLGIPQHLFERINPDHHKYHAWTTPAETDSTHKILDTIEERIAGNGGDLAKTVDGLKHSFALISTDNLGDAMWSIWIRDHFELVVGNSKLRETIRHATHFEDFGGFGRIAEKAAAESGPDSVLYQSIELQKAILVQYDDLLTTYSKKYPGLIAGDRFDKLPPSAQIELVTEAKIAIDTALSDPRELAARFDTNRREIAAKIKSSHTEFATKYNSAAFKRVDRLTYVYQAPFGDFFFSTSMAASFAHERPLQLSFLPRGEGKVGFILAVPNGEKISIDLNEVAEAIRRKAETKFSGAGKSIGARGTDLAYSFEGIPLTPEEILEVVSGFIPIR
jgi:hypothetical protein